MANLTHTMNTQDKTETKNETKTETPLILTPEQRQLFELGAYIALVGQRSGAKIELPSYWVAALLGKGCVGMDMRPVLDEYLGALASLKNLLNNDPAV